MRRPWKGLSHPSRSSDTNTILGRRGYLAKVTYTIDLSPGTSTTDGSAVIRYAVVAGPRLRVRRIDIVNRGTRELRTRKSFIRSFISDKPGDIVNLATLDRAQTRFADLGIFSFVDVHVEPVRAGAGAPQASSRTARAATAPAASAPAGSGSTAPADVIVSVNEADTRFIEISGGFGSYEKLRGSLTCTDRDIFGLGRHWSLSARGSFKTCGISSSLTDRLFLGGTSTLTADAGFDYRNAPAFELSQAQVGIDMSFRLSNDAQLNASYHYTYSLTKSKETPASAKQALTTGRILTGIDYDTRDSVVIPRRGVHLNLSPFVASRLIGSRLDFGGFDATATAYLPVFRGVTMSFHLGYSARYLFGGTTKLPIQERLFLGGADSVRSYGQDELSPVNADGVPIGGLSSAEASVETRFHLIGALHLAIFYDVGVVSPQSLGYEGAFGQAVGAGFRYYLPVGPIRLDVGYNPGNLYGAKLPYSVHLAAGFSY